ncbi:hypothetical protein TNCV_1547131 [Trichonephila clavipes]|nr:hypothetical protein TNCV_1547131 [Trichonephila clavipes]
MCFLPPPLKKNSLAMGAYIPTPGRIIAPINIGVCHKNFPARKQGNDRRQRPLSGNSALVPDQSEEIKWTSDERDKLVSSADITSSANNNRITTLFFPLVQIDSGAVMLNGLLHLNDYKGR